jgi:hypothetical protein
VALGAATIWTNKSADIATAHVAVGALTLTVGTLLLLMARRCLARLPESEAVAGLMQQPMQIEEIKLPA